MYSYPTVFSYQSRSIFEDGRFCKFNLALDIEERFEARLPI